MTFSSRQNGLRRFAEDAPSRPQCGVRGISDTAFPGFDFMPESTVDTAIVALFLVPGPEALRRWSLTIRQETAGISSHKRNRDNVCKA